VDGQRRKPVWRELDDATLLAYLRQALREHETPPPRVVELAKASFALHRLDAELAALVADSLDEVELVPGGAGGRRVGQLDPSGSARIELRRPDGSSGAAVDADRRGRFALDVSGPGPISLLCRRPGRPVVVTAWVLLG
jgi:hypothetical protein